MEQSDVEFHGFAVTGFHPDTLNAARSHSYVRMVVWDEEAWMDRHKPVAVVGEPFMLLAAAKECAEIARRDGWKRVKVVNCLVVKP